MQISSIYVQSGAAEQTRKALSGDSTTNSKKETQKVKTNSESTSAKVSISGDSSKSGSAEALVKARANALPEIREEKVNLAKDRIKSGYYNTPEFSKELSNRLAEG